MYMSVTFSASAVANCKRMQAMKRRNYSYVKYKVQGCHCDIVCICKELTK